MNLRDKIIEEFNSGAFAFKPAGYIFTRLHARPSEKKSIEKILKSLENEGVIMRDFRGDYATPEQMGVFKAVVQGNERGFAFLIPEAGGGDYFVPRNFLNGALNKDVVLAARIRGTEDQAYIIKILERGVKRVTGVFDCDRRAGYVMPDDIKFCEDVYIKPANFKNAKRGDKVVAEIINYVRGKMPEGKIVEILGEDGDFFCEELAIIRSYGLYENFSAAAENEAESASRQPIKPERRRDLRGLYTITIDGEDTRDIDDAVSLEIKDGKYVLGVHIADVSEYVKLNGKLDREAYARGTSVYFPDRVLPMLPKALSNGACSLNEGEERYALSCFMTFSADGRREGYDICESVIKSDRRMTYAAVNAILSGDEEACAKYPELCERARNMLELSRILQRRRDGLGAVNLEVKEAHITIVDGEIVIPDYERGEAEKIIEQFMVSTNEAVAEFAQKRALPFMYRVHERPAPEKAAAFKTYLKTLGVNADFDVDEVSPADFSRVLEREKDEPYYPVINKVMLRSMQKARYCEVNKGHFGLASDCYCHFTSPIRRYPDLFVHRVIKAVLRGESERAKRVYGDIAAQATINASERERGADEAERAVDDLYKCAYMEERIGQEFEGVISGVTSFGVFVELKNSVEGLIKLENLPGDGYIYYEERYTLKNNANEFKLGDEIKIRVDACDFASRRVLFSPICAN